MLKKQIVLLAEFAILTLFIFSLLSCPEKENQAEVIMTGKMDAEIPEEPELPEHQIPLAPPYTHADLIKKDGPFLLIETDRVFQVSLKDPSGKIQWYSSDEERGYIDQEGRITLNGEYTVCIVAEDQEKRQFDSVILIGYFKDPAWVVSPGQRGYINKEGQSLKIHTDETVMETGDFEYGLALIRTAEDPASPYNHHYSYINERGEIISENDRFRNSRVTADRNILVEVQGKSGMVDPLGNEIIPLLYNSISYGGPGIYQVYDGQFYGFVDSKGNPLIDLEYSRADPFSGETALVATGEIHKEYYRINRSNEIVFSYPQRWENMNLFGDLVFTNYHGGGSDPLKTEFMHIDGNPLYMDSWTNGLYESWVSIHIHLMIISGKINRFYDSYMNEPDRFDPSYHYESIMRNGLIRFYTIDGEDISTLRMGVMNYNGEIIIPPEFGYLSPMTNGGYFYACREVKRREDQLLSGDDLFYYRSLDEKNQLLILERNGETVMEWPQEKFPNHIRDGLATWSNFENTEIYNLQKAELLIQGEYR